MSDESFGSWVRKQAIRDLFWTDFVRELIQKGELKDSMKSYNDFANYFKEQVGNEKQLESLNEAHKEFAKFKRYSSHITRENFKKIYEKTANARNLLLSQFSKINQSLTIKNPNDINLYETLDSITSELNSLLVLLEDVSFDHIENFEEGELQSIKHVFTSSFYPRMNIEFELLEIARDEFRKEKYRNRNKLVPKGSSKS
ncbi:hypothetical protein CH361_12160 [Leptospira brenneri]|nr:hypothetical protein CH361_12160 [Leptospira brenneri]